MGDDTDLIALLNDDDLELGEIACKLLLMVYDELRALAQNYLRGERKEHTLQPTALVHEVFM